MRGWKDVATLVKAKGLNGRFVAKPATNLPYMLAVGTEVAFVPPQTDLPRSGRVDYVRDIDGVSYAVGFDAISDEAAAHGIAGCHCLVRRDDLDEGPYEETPAAWVGWRVVEAGGDVIGDVSSLVENPGQDLLEVQREQAGAAYIPVVEEFIRDVDVEQRTITVTLPAGLLDL